MDLDKLQKVLDAERARLFNLESYHHIKDDRSKKSNSEKAIAYRKSKSYRIMKSLRFKYDNHKCVKCGTPDKLLLHHLNYDRYFVELLTDVVTCCIPCHNCFHEIDETTNKKGKKMPSKNSLRQKIRDDYYGKKNGVYDFFQAIAKARNEDKERWKLLGDKCKKFLTENPAYNPSLDPDTFKSITDWESWCGHLLTDSKEEGGLALVVKKPMIRRTHTAKAEIENPEVSANVSKGSFKETPRKTYSAAEVATMVKSASEAGVKKAEFGDCKFEW
jgi:hypothetical protein